VSGILPSPPCLRARGGGGCLRCAAPTAIAPFSQRAAPVKRAPHHILANLLGAPPLAALDTSTPPTFGRYTSSKQQPPQPPKNTATPIHTHVPFTRARMRPLVLGPTKTMPPPQLAGAPFMRAVFAHRIIALSAPKPFVRENPIPLSRALPARTTHTQREPLSSFTHTAHPLLGAAANHHLSSPLVPLFRPFLPDFKQPFSDCLFCPPQTTPLIFKLCLFPSSSSSTAQPHTPSSCVPCSTACLAGLSRRHPQPPCLAPLLSKKIPKKRSPLLHSPHPHTEIDTGRAGRAVRGPFAARLLPPPPLTLAESTLVSPPGLSQQTTKKRCSFCSAHAGPGGRAPIHAPPFTQRELVPACLPRWHASYWALVLWRPAGSAAATAAALLPPRPHGPSPLSACPPPFLPFF
jgi:hypothetical protein